MAAGTANVLGTFCFLGDLRTAGAEDGGFNVFADFVVGRDISADSSGNSSLDIVAVNFVGKVFRSSYP